MNLKAENLFIGTATLVISAYMGKDTKTQVTDLIVADDIDQAEEKFKEHYGQKGSEYDSYYSLEQIEVKKAIV